MLRTSMKEWYLAETNSLKNVQQGFSGLDKMVPPLRLGWLDYFQQQKVGMQRWHYYL